MRVEVDGPPSHQFEIAGEVFFYIAFAAESRFPEKLVAGLVQHLDEMRRAGVIVWRTRPKIEHLPESEGYWQIYYRVVVIPFKKFNDYAIIDIPQKAEGARVVRLD